MIGGRKFFAFFGNQSSKRVGGNHPYSSPPKIAHFRPFEANLKYRWGSEIHNFGLLSKKKNCIITLIQRKSLLKKNVGQNIKKTDEMMDAKKPFINTIMAELEKSVHCGTVAPSVKIEQAKI